MNLAPLYEFTKFGLELLKRMIVQWYFTAISVMACVVLVIAYAHRAGPQYTTIMKVIPAEMLHTGGTEPTGAAKVLGLSLGSSSSPRMTLYLELLQSPAVAQALMNKYHLEKTLFGSSLDPKTGEWIDSYARRKQAFIYRLFGLQLPRRPTAQDVAGAINGMLLLDHDSNGFSTISCTSSDPKICSKILPMVHEEAQSILKAMEFDQANAISKYLSQELPQVPQLEAREAMGQQLASAQREIALASMKGDSIAAVLEKPLVPNLPTFPNPSLMLSLAYVMGAVFGAAISWFAWGLSLGSLQNWLRSRIAYFRFKVHT
jgi:uncharacterized protein involved in exopolysaccharide biosynthesis